NSAAVNDSGINVSCGAGLLVIPTDGGCLVSDTVMNGLGGQGIHTMLSAAGAVTLSNVEMINVYRENIDADGPTAATDVAVGFDGANNGAGNGEHQLHSAIRVLGPAASFTNLGVAAVRRKNLIQIGSGSVSLHGGFFFGGSESNLAVGTAGAGSSS